MLILRFATSPRTLGAWVTTLAATFCPSFAAALPAGLGPAGNFTVPSVTQADGYFGYALTAGDFDGDGLADLAVGALGDDTNGPWSGRVDVFLADGFGLALAGSWVGDPLSYGGTSLAAGDFDGDGIDEIAVGAIGETVDGQPWAGEVVILAWDPAAGQVAVLGSFSQATAALGETPEANDAFGQTLASGDFNQDGYDDLAIGVPYEELDAAVLDHGLVHVLDGSPTGLTSVGAQVWTQDSAGVLGAAGAGDLFGSALAAGDFDGDTIDDLAIGVPGEAGVSSLATGGVAVLYGTQAAGLAAGGNQLWIPGAGGLPGGAKSGDDFGWALCAGDFDGDGRSDLAIGAPYAGGGSDGAVFTLPGSISGLTGTGSRRWTPLDVTGAAGGTLDRFGWALACASFDGDPYDDLAIGGPAADLGGPPNVGAVDVLVGGLMGLTAAGAQRFSSSGLASAPSTPWEQFGSALATGDFDGNGHADLAIGIPWRSSTADPAGIVQVLLGDSGLLFCDGFETGDTGRWSNVVP